MVVIEANNCEKGKNQSLYIVLSQHFLVVTFISIVGKCEPKHPSLEKIEPHVPLHVKPM